MNELQEIPNYAKALTFFSAVGWSLAVAAFAAIIAIVVFVIKSRKQFPGEPVFDQMDINESIDAITAVIAIWFVSFLSLLFASSSSGNSDEVRSAAFHNITAEYTVDLEMNELKIFYEDVANLSLKGFTESSDDLDTGGRAIKEVKATYDDLDTGTRYDLVFVFKDNKEPVLLKTGNITDELINQLKK